MKNDEVIFYDYGDEETIVNQKFDSIIEATAWAFSYEYNYDECIGEIQICNNLDKIYNIKMNILQLSVYYSLNKLINTPKNIAHELEMDLPTLGLIINSLLVSNLIYRKYESNPDQEKDQEPELKFYINLEFTHAENKLSAISNYNRLKLLLNN